MHINELFNLDSLALIMLILIGFISAITGFFASRYLEGDSKRTAFLVTLAGLTASLGVMVTADNLILFVTSWLLSNILLIHLMIHKSCWRAAVESGLLTARTLTIGFCSLTLGLYLLHHQTHATTITGIASLPANGETTFALILIILAAMTQSSIWPCHRWLLSSLNSPTPTSAFMHAGLVNGGGFLLARFAPLYISHAFLLSSIFVIGIVTALLGMIWKLLQSDVKRMLACSTMSQMGFMLAQCGMGLFAAAVAHLCWHGLYKAYYFLNVNNVINERRVEPFQPTAARFLLGLACGVIGGIVFAYTSNKSLLQANTNLLLIAVAIIFCAQAAMSMLSRLSITSIIKTLSASAAIGLVYGINVYLIELALPEKLTQPQPLSAIYLIGLGLLAAFWLGLLFKEALMKRPAIARRRLHLYVQALNASQPHPATITTQRRDYRFK